MPNSRFALHGKRPSLIHGLCAFFASNSRFMHLFQATPDTPLDSPSSATSQFTVCTSRFARLRFEARFKSVRFRGSVWPVRFCKFGLVSSVRPLVQFHGFGSVRLFLGRRLGSIGLFDHQCVAVTSRAEEHAVSLLAAIVLLVLYALTPPLVECARHLECIEIRSSYFRSFAALSH